MKLLGKKISRCDAKAIDKILQKVLIRETITNADLPSNTDTKNKYLYLIRYYNVALINDNANPIEITHLDNEPVEFLKKNGFTRIYAEYFYVRFNIIMSYIIVTSSIATLIITIWNMTKC